MRKKSEGVGYPLCERLSDMMTKKKKLGEDWQKGSGGEGKNGRWKEEREQSKKTNQRIRFAISLKTVRKAERRNESNTST